MIWYITLLSHFSNHQLWVCQSLGGFVSFKLRSGVHVSRIKIDDLTLNCLNSGTVYINCSQLRLWWHSTPPITNPEPLNNDVWRTTVLFEKVHFQRNIRSFWDIISSGITSLPILQGTRARPPHGEGPHANSTQIRASGGEKVEKMQKMITASASYYFLSRILGTRVFHKDIINNHCPFNKGLILTFVSLHPLSGFQSARI